MPVTLLFYIAIDVTDTKWIIFFKNDSGCVLRILGVIVEMRGNLIYFQSQTMINKVICKLLS